MAYDPLGIFPEEKKATADITPEAGFDPLGIFGETKTSAQEPTAVVDPLSRALLGTDPGAKAREMLNNNTGNPITGAVTDLAKGLYTGVTRRVPELIGQAMEFSGIAPETGKAMADWATAGEKPLEGEQPKEKGLFEQTGEMIPSSAGIPLALGTAGRLVSMIPHPAARLIGTGLQLASYLQPLIFGLSQAQQTKDSAEEKVKSLQEQIGKTTDETEKSTLQTELDRVQGNAKWAPYATGTIETAGETLANVALQRLLGPLAGTLKNAGTATIKDFARPTVKQFLKTLAIETIPTETSTEFGQQWGEALVEKKVGIRPEANPLQEGLDVLAPTALMTILTGAPAHVAQRYGVNRMLKNFSSPVEGYSPYDQNLTPEIRNQIQDRKSMADVMAKMIESDDTPEAKALSEQWKDYAYGQIALNLPVEVNKPIHDLNFKQETPGATQPTETPGQPRPEDYVTPVDTQGVKIPAIVAPVEKGPESEIRGIPDLLFEWTKKKPSRILDQEKYSPEKMAEQFNISVDLAKKALEETKGKLITEVERKIANLEKHPDVVNRGQRGPEEKASRPVNNYVKLLNQYSQLTGRPYDRSMQGGLHGEVQPGQEPGGAVPGSQGGGETAVPGGILQKQGQGEKGGEGLVIAPSLTPAPVNMIRREDGKLYAAKPEEQAQAEAHAKEAERLGLVYNGLQPDGSAQFTDKETGKAFIAQPGQVEEGLKSIRPSTTSGISPAPSKTSATQDVVVKTTPEIKLTAKAVPGKEGVTRLTYLKDDHIVGNARLLGGTIGDIMVNKKVRRQGIGMAMVKDLVERGGNSATTVNAASRGLFAKAGFVEDRPDHFVLTSPSINNQQSTINNANGGPKVVENLKKEEIKTELPDKKGRDLFTPEELAEFDRLKIDVSGVTENYKAEALQQIAFKTEHEGETPEEYNARIKAEYERQEQTRKEKEEPARVLTDEEVESLFDEAQKLLRSLPNNMGKAKQEGKLSKNQLAALDRLDEIEKILPQNSDQWKKIFDVRRAESDKKTKEIYDKFGQEQRDRLAKTPFQIGEKVRMVAASMLPHVRGSVYEGEIRQSKTGVIYVHTKQGNFDIFNNPWHEVEATPEVKKEEPKAPEAAPEVKKEETVPGSRSAGDMAGMTEKDIDSVLDDVFGQKEEKPPEKTEPKPIPMNLGSKTEVSTPKTGKITVQYAVVDIRDLITSHDESLNLNPDYPQELQPRNRTRLASEEQIGRIINKLDPNLLGANPMAQHGAPIVTDTGVVLSGNARTIAMKRIYGEAVLSAVQGNAYQNWLDKNAKSFGLDPAVVDRFQDPILVRVDQSGMALVKLAQESNEEAIASMSPSETALNDAEKMGPSLMDVFAPSDEGNILTHTNREFIRLFMRDVVSPNEVNALTTRDGDLSQAGIARIRNAVFAKAFGDVEVLERLAESTDNNVRNITNGMLTASAGLMKVKAGIEEGRLYPVDISRDITMAMRKLSDIRNQGVTYEDYLKQPDMFDTMTPESKIILGIFNKYSRSAKKIGEWLNLYAEITQASPKADPNQGNLFGDLGEKVEPTKADLIKAANQKMEALYGPVKKTAEPDLFSGQTVQAGSGQETTGESPEVQKPGEIGEAPQKQETPKPGLNLPDLTVSGSKPLPGYPGVIYVVGHRKPDLIPDTFKVVITRQNPFLSIDATGLSAEEAFRKALGYYKDKIKPAETITAAPLTQPKSYYFTNEKGKYEIHFDRAEFNALPQNVKKDIKAYFLWAPSKKAWVSKGQAGPSRYAIHDIFGRAGLTERKQTPAQALLSGRGGVLPTSTETPVPVTTKGLAQKAGLEALEAVQEGMKGLAALFTPKNTLGAGMVFNEDTYSQAKPHFEAMLKAAIQAGHTVNDLVKHIYEAFGDQIRPYLKRFMADQAEKPKEVAPTDLGRHPLEELRRALERRGAGRLGEIDYKIIGFDNGSWGYMRTENGNRIEKGGVNPTGGGWSYERAIDAAMEEADFDHQGMESGTKEDPFTAAVGVLSGSKADRIKDSKYEFAYGPTEKDSDIYWDMVGMFTGGKADQLIEAGITLKEKETKETANTPEALHSGIVADWVTSQLEAGMEITRESLFSQSDAAFGGKKSEGKYTAKDAFDALEMGINRYIADSIQTMSSFDPRLDMKYARDQIDLIRKRILDKIPSQLGIRTAEMDEFQQFSTPPDLAFTMAWAAKMSHKDIVLEPSAGIGGIAVFAKKAGAKTIVNELSPRRAALIENMGFDQVFTENAEQINNILPPDIQPTVVLMNPPFSSTAGRIPGQRSSINVVTHLDQAFKRLADGGRLVALIGKGYFVDPKAVTDYLKNIVDNYNLRANIIVGGKGYVKYGTHYDNRILVFDKTAPDGKPTVKGQVEDVKDAIPLLQEVRNERTFREPGQIKPEVPGIPAGEKAGNRPEPTVLPSTHAVVPGQRGTEGIGQPADRNPGKPAGGGSETGLPVSETGGGRGGIPNSAGPGTEGHETGRPGPGNVGKPGLETKNTSSGLSPSENTGLELERVKEEEHPADITDSLYENYSPKKAIIKGSKPHPGPIVESAAMASVDPPGVTYRPHLPQEIIDKGWLSNVQIEPIIYAGQAHQEIMPNGERMGYFIGDGTGVGKGREIAGILLDNWNQGRKKALWLSQNSPLSEDARRDVKGVGWVSDHVFDLGKIKFGSPIRNNTGVAFLGYSLLRMKKDITTGAGRNATVETVSRLGQIIDWFGKDYDGVIVFDESHNMGNAVAVKGKRGTQKPSAMALAGLELQRSLPNARVVYVSATGATEVMNLAYAERLGLWGEGTAFVDAGDFITKVGAGGLNSMELVARDLKSLGKYAARSLSYDKVGYDRLIHPLTPEQRGIYDELAGAWQITLKNIDSALEETGVTGTGKNGKTVTLNGEAKSAAKSKFWGAHQRFFNQIITSMQMPTVIKAAEQDLKDGKAVVMQLVNTNEAATNRNISRMQEEEDIEDLDLTPREQLMEYVRNSFPVHQYQQYADQDGNIKSELVLDSQGNPVLNAEAVAMREALLDRLGSIRVPDNPMDMVINHFGAKNVAEVTGRTKRIVEVDDEKGRHRIIERRSKSKAMADADAFMADKKQVLIFSYAGGTGRSYHADLAAINQRERSHYLVQPGWRADRAVQGLGRTHRTNQAQPPNYHLVTTDLNGQKRFISSIARRLDQLGALTRGQRETGSQGLFAERDNLESKYAEDALDGLIQDIANGKTDMGLGEFSSQLGLNIIDDQGNLKVSALPNIPQFLNRLLSMQIDPQNRLFDMFSERLDMQIARAIRNGTLDAGLETIRAKKIEKVSDQTVYTEPKSGAETRFVELELTKDAKLIPWDQSGRFSQGGYVQNIKSGRAWALSNAQMTTDSNTGRVSYLHKAAGVNFGIHNINRDDVDDQEKYRKLSKSEAQKIWDEEYEEQPKEVRERNYLITGALLPIYNRLPEGNVRIVRVQTATGERMIGRLIPATQVGIVKERLGAETTAVKMSPEEVFNNVLHQNYTVQLANGWTIVRKKVSGEDRVEVKGADWKQMDQLRSFGGFSERINYETRLFIPTTEDGPAIIKRMLQNNPILSATTRRNAADIIAGAEEQAAYGVERQYPGLMKEMASHFKNNLGIMGHDLEDAKKAFGSIASQLSFDLSGSAGEVSSRPQKPAYKVIGHGFAETLIQNGSADYRGRVINHPSDLALLAQVFRNPKFETLRIFYTNEGMIVGHEGFTSRMPGYVSLSPGGEKEYVNKRVIPEIKAKMAKLGADGFWTVHNHPSGNVAASQEDRDLHAFLDQRLDLKLKGGIILNGGKYGLLERKQRTDPKTWNQFLDIAFSEHKLPRAKKDRLKIPSIPHPMLGTIISTSETLASVAAAAKSDPTMVTALYLTGQNEVRGIQEVPAGLFTNYKGMTDYFRGRLRDFGATNVIPVFPENEKVITKEIMENVKRGIIDKRILDMAKIGSSSTLRQMDPDLRNSPSGDFFGKEPIKSFHASEPGAGEQYSAVPTFYSKMERFLSDKLPNTGIPLQWKSMVENWAKKGEFKAEELKWSGLGQWLVEQKGKISKQAVFDFLKENRVEIREVTKGREIIYPDNILTPKMIYAQEQGGWDLFWEEYARMPQEGKDKINDWAAAHGEDTKFAQWQLPGGKDYRELLLTLPENVGHPEWKEESVKLNLEIKGGGRGPADTKRWTATINGADYQITYNPHQQRYVLDGENGGLMNAGFKTLEEAQAYALKGSDYKHSGRNLFRSDHWSEPNVAAHVRFNDRTDAEGNRVLFLEEIQSDWANEGRKKGFNEPRPTAADIEVRPYEGRYAAWIRGLRVAGGDTEEAARRTAEEWLPQLDDNRLSAGPPSFPFHKSWQELVLKRVLRYAAEKGYDKIAWINGEETANRYDLSKYLDEVTSAQAPNGDYYIEAYDKKGNPVRGITGKELHKEELAGYVGKDLAAKIIDFHEKHPNEGENRPEGNFSGLDLKVGGEWAHNLYDKMIPQFLNKYGKQWGAKVEDVKFHGYYKVGNTTLKLSDQAKGDVFQSLPITPSMKESVLNQGQPLFNAQEPSQASSPVGLEDIRRIFKGQEVSQIAEGYRIRTNGNQFIEIKEVKHIGDNQIAFETSYGRQRADDEIIAGSYKKGRIKLVKGVANNWVLSHESVHLMEDMGIITPGEAALLENHIKGLVKAGKFETANPDKIGGAEDRANFIADQLINPSPENKGFITRILVKINEFIDRLVNAFGVRTAQGITRDIESGKIFNREGFGEYGQAGGKEQATFAGLGASEAEIHIARIADAMAKEGSTPEEIWKSTGWIKGVDGKWRFEIDDSQARVTPIDDLESWGTREDMKHGNSAGAFLGGLLTHPTLFDNYPDLRQVWVRLLPDFAGGSFNGRDITVGFDAVTGKINKSALLHEIQHYIQDKEGFARGANVSQFKPISRYDVLSKDLDRRDREFWNNSPEEFKQLQRKVNRKDDGWEDTLEEIKAKYPEQEELYFRLKQERYLLERDKDFQGEITPYEQYKKTAGEAEAREVQKRMGWTAQERAATPPSWDGIPEKDLIVRLGRGGGQLAPEEDGQQERLAVLKSRTDLDQAKVDAEISNFDKSSFKDSMATIKDMAKNWGKAERPGRPDTSLMGRFFGSPEFTFEKVPALKKVVNYNLERADLRVGKFNDLISDPAGRDLHEGLRVLQKDRPEEYQRLGKLLVRADQNKRVYDVASLSKMGFSDQAVTAWADARAIMDNGFDRQIASYKEMVRRNAEAGLPAPTIVVLDEKGHPKEVSVKTAIALMGEMRGWYWPRLRESGGWQIVAKGTPEMKDRGFHNRLEFKDFFVEHRVAQLRQQGYQVEYFKSKSIPEDLFAIYGKVMGTEQMINEALNRSLQAVGNKSNFQFSDMGIKAMWSTSADDKPDFILDTKKVPQERLAKIMPVIRALGGRWYSAQQGEPKFWHFVDKGKNIETRLRRSLSRYDNRLLAVEEEFARALTVNVANIEKGRGFRSSMIQRGPEVGLDVWEGYEQDPLKAMTSYASRLAAGEAKKETALKMIRAFNGTEKSWAQFKEENEEAEYEDYMKYVESQKVSPTEQKNAYHDGLTYIQEALRNPEMADRVVGTVKGLANFKYLGFRVAAPLVNMTALITSVPAAMQGYAGISLPSTFKWLGKGADLWRQYRHPETWATLPAETQAAFHIIQHKGWADSQYNREAMEVLKSKVGRGWNRVMEWSMYMFATTEQLNRVATIMGTFTAIREREGGSQKTGTLSENELAAVEKAMETAKHVSDRAHGVYGPATIPAVAQGKGPAGMVVKSLYMFKKFQHNYLQTLYELGWKQSNWKAATYMLAAPTLLAGAGAFPVPWAWEAMMGILKHLFGWDDPEEKFFSSMEHGLGEYIGGIPRQGIAGVGGHLFDMRASLGTGKLDVPTNMIELLGAPGSVFNDLYQGGADILKGNVEKGTEKIMPRFIGTAMQANREATEGVTTKTNAPVFFGREQIKENVLDAALKSLSFNPARIQRMKDIEWSEKRVWQDYKDRRGEIESGFLKFYLQPEDDRDKASMVDLIDLVRDYNNRVRSHGLAGVEPMITSESLKMYISRNLKPSKKEIIKDRNRTL